MQCCSSSPTPFTLEYPTTSQAGFPNFQSSLPGHTCSGWPGLSRELSLSSPQLAFTALGCSWDLQSPWMCPPCLQHTAIAEGIWCSALAVSCCISHLADLPAVCQGPVITTLCVSEWPQPQFAWCDTRGKRPTGSCWASLPFGEADRAEQSRAQHSRDPALLSAEKMERPGDIALCPLLPAALDSP